MDKIFGFSNKRAIINICIFVGLTVASTLITYWQLKPFAVRTDISQLVHNEITFMGILTNNLIVCTLAVAGIILFKVPSILVLVINPIVLGFVLGVNWVSTEQVAYFLKILIAHAIFEIPAISISCAIGMEGKEFIRKYNRASIARAGGLVIVLLMAAAFVECNVSVGNI